MYDEWRGMRSGGVKEFLRHLVMYISFPVRRPIVTVWVLAVCVAMILCLHAPVLKLWNKYTKLPQVNEVIKAKDKTIAYVEDKVENVKQKLAPIEMKKVNAEKEAEKDKSPRFVAWNVKKFRHAKPDNDDSKDSGFLLKENDSVKENNVKTAISKVGEYAEKLKYHIVDSYDDKDIEKKETSSTDKARKKQNIAKAKIDKNATYFSSEPDENGEVISVNIRDLYYEKSVLKLDYMALPEIWEGQIDVLTPNSFEMGDDLVYLYGIYSTPSAYDTDEAKRYLKEITEQQNVVCYVVAYTRKSHNATALCFVNGLFINQDMVDKNLAKNVALR